MSWGLEKELQGWEEDIITWITWIKIFISAQTSKQYQITKYFNYQTGFNGVFSRDTLPKIKDGAYDISFNDRKSKGTHWVSLFI